MINAEPGSEKAVYDALAAIRGDGLHRHSRRGGDSRPEHDRPQGPRDPRRHLHRDDPGDGAEVLAIFPPHHGSSPITAPSPLWPLYLTRNAVCHHAPGGRPERRRGRWTKMGPIKAPVGASRGSLDLARFEVFTFDSDECYINLLFK